MAFDTLSDRMQMALRRVTGRAKLNESDIEEMLKEVRLSLLEADVNYKVVKEFLQIVKNEALGEKILKGLNPGEQVVKIVRDTLKQILGEEYSEINFNINSLTTLMMVGLQGAGKTTAVGKIANYYRKKLNKKPMLIAADIYRPAAIDQLKTIGKQLNIEVFEMGINQKAEVIVEKGLKYAKEKGYDLVIIDTAGRLQINEALMNELVNLKKIANPEEILLTVDAMTGQEAVNVAKAFNETLSVSGVVLTKMDGDTRGGAALSIKAITKVPIKLMSVGEKMDDLEIFYPDRLADRILGMGDVLSLIDKVTDNIDEDEMLSMAEKLSSGKFNYNDLLKQFDMLKRMGSISRILGFLPGFKGVKEAMNNGGDEMIQGLRHIIYSMTKEERKDPKLIEQSAKRRQRIARGCGKKVSDVQKLIDALNAQVKMLKQMKNIDFENMDQDKMEEQLRRGQFPGLSQPNKPYVHKGKGKNRGFRF